MGLHGIGLLWRYFFDGNANEGCNSCASLAGLVRPPGTVVLEVFYFARDVSFFSTRNLRAPLADHRETSPHGQNLCLFYKLTPKIRGALPPKTLGAKNMQNFGQFHTTSDFDR